eukprot:6596908-Prymnesium_polylepis.2
MYPFFHFRPAHAVDDRVRDRPAAARCVTDCCMLSSGTGVGVGPRDPAPCRCAVRDTLRESVIRL